jgi:hypothetical protein
MWTSLTVPGYVIELNTGFNPRVQAHFILEIKIFSEFNFVAVVISALCSEQYPRLVISAYRSPIKFDSASKTDSTTYLCSSFAGFIVTSGYLLWCTGTNVSAGFMPLLCLSGMGDWFWGYLRQPGSELCPHTTLSLWAPNSVWCRRRRDKFALTQRGPPEHAFNHTFWSSASLMVRLMVESQTYPPSKPRLYIGHRERLSSRPPRYKVWFTRLNLKLV